MTRKQRRKNRKQNRGQITAVNISRGIATEQRIVNTLPKELLPKKVTSGKKTFDRGIPDVVITDPYTKKQRYIEVKTIGEWISESGKVVHGRVQLKRTELEELQKTNGVVIIEVRERNKDLEESGKKRYYQALAKDVLKKVKDEKGEELKLEYSEVISLQEYKLGTEPIGFDKSKRKGKKPKIQPSEKILQAINILDEGEGVTKSDILEESGITEKVYKEEIPKLIKNGKILEINKNRMIVID